MPALAGEVGDAAAGLEVVAVASPVVTLCRPVRQIFLLDLIGQGIMMVVTASAAAAAVVVSVMNVGMVTVMMMGIAVAVVVTVAVV